MRAIILAAGRGEGLKPLTQTHAKVALHFLNRPLIHYALDHAVKGGATHIGINLHHLPASVQSALAEWDGPPLEFFFSREEKLLGTGGALAAFAQWSGDETTLVLHGDTLIDFNPRHLELALSLNRAHAALLVRHNKDIYKVSSVVMDDAGKVRQIAGMPPAAAGVAAGKSYATAGAQCFSPGFIRKYGGPGDLNHDIYPKLIATQAPLFAMEMDKPVWADVGTRERFLGATGAALTRMQSGKWPLAAAKHSRLSSGTAGLLLADESVKLHGVGLVVEGFAVLGVDAMLLGDCRLRNSVVMPGGRIGRGAEVVNSIVGPKAYVPPGTQVSDTIVV